MEFKKVSIGKFSYGTDEGLRARETDSDLERDDEGSEDKN